MVIVNLISPVAVFAQRKSTTTPRQPKVQEEFCAGLPQRSSELLARFDALRQKVEDRRSERSGNIDNRRDAREQKDSERRANQNNSREEHYAKLKERAENDAQKQAVTAFQAAVEAAVVARRASIQAALDSYRSSIDALIIERDVAIRARMGAWRSAVQTAFAVSRSDCASGADLLQVRQTLQTSLRAAKDAFNDDRRAIQRPKDKLEELRNQRKEAFRKAHDDFKEAIENARTDLKIAFGEN